MQEKHGENTKIKVASFDFDGVFVLDSDAVFKKEAYEKIFSGYQGRHGAALSEAKVLFGSGKPGGRGEVLRYVFRKLGEPENTLEMRVKKESLSFDRYVQEKIASAGLVPGSVEMLNDLSRRGVALYLNSGTATAALSESALNLGIAGFFKMILGSTPEPVGGSKAENLRFILEKEGIGPDGMLFVGDSDYDAEAARECGCRFLGVSNRWNRWKAGEKPFPLVEDLRDVARHL